MSSLISTFLPYLLLLFFLVRSLKNPFFLLGIPFLLFLRYCIFFDSVKILNVPGRISEDVRLLGWLILIWILFLVLSNYKKDVNQKYLLGNKKFNSLDMIMIALIIISIVDFIVVQSEYVQGDLITNEFFTLMALFVGFFIIRSFIIRTEDAIVKDFFYWIVLINTMASVLYFIHQGLNYTLYTNPYFEEVHITDLVKGVKITRTFWFMPILWYFSIAYLLVFKKKKWFFNYSLIGINLLAIFISYTRSALIEGVMVILLYFVMISIKNKSFLSILKYVLGIGIGLTLFYFTISKLFPANTTYFMDRISRVASNPNDEEDNSIIFRFNRTRGVLAKMEQGKLLFGMGPITEKQLPLVSDMLDITADMVWTEVIFRWGYIGFILFILLYLLGLINSYRLFLNSSGIYSQFALVIFLTIVSQIMESFINWTFMSPSRFALGLWYFGFLSALINLNDRKETSFIVLNENN